MPFKSAAEDAQRGETTAHAADAEPRFLQPKLNTRTHSPGAQA